MKIACIAASQVPSTTANSMQVMKACLSLNQLGHEVRLFVPGNHQQDEMIDLQAYYGLSSAVEIEWLPSRRRFHRYDFACLAARRARRMKANLCYVWLLQAGVSSLLAGMPVVIELHGPPEGRFGPFLFRFFQLWPGKKRLLPITQALSGQIQSRFKVDARSMRISPNGINLERYTNLPEPAVAREQLALPPMLTVGYTGHLYPGRGMNLMVELSKSFPQAHFLWVGGKPADADSWREYISSEKITNLTLAGFVENYRLPLYQAACDILLMPYEKAIAGSSGGNSTTYASPMKMFEYMASRRAIISSDLPVIREVLSDSNAILCPPEEIRCWSLALELLISDPERRLRLSERAWRDVQRYTWLERARKALDGFVS